MTPIEHNDLRSALEPFAREASRHDGWDDNKRVEVPLGQLRDASRALASDTIGNGGGEAVPKHWAEVDAHRDLSRIIPDMERKIADAKRLYGHCLPKDIFAPLEMSITELRVLRHEVAHPIAAEPVGLREHFQRMMDACANYVEPTTYIARHPDLERLGDCKWVREFDEPNKHQSDTGKRQTKERRDQAFINDMIYMLDGPEQRQALTTPARTDEAAQAGGELIP